MFLLASYFVNPYDPSAGLVFGENSGASYMTSGISAGGAVFYSSFAFPFSSFEGAPLFLSLAFSYSKTGFPVTGGLRFSTMYSRFYREGRVNLDAGVNFAFVSDRLSKLVEQLLGDAESLFFVLSPVVVFRSLSLSEEYLSIEPLKRSSLVGLSADLSFGYRGSGTVAFVYAGNIFSTDVGFISYEALEPFLKGGVGYRVSRSPDVWASAALFADRWGINAQAGIWWNFLKNSLLSSSLLLAGSFSSFYSGFVFSFSGVSLAYSFRYDFSLSDFGHFASVELRI